jgi:hypothetical protein
VGLAVGASDGTPCDIGDANGDGEVTVDEILTAVDNALEGCASAGAR